MKIKGFKTFIIRTSTDNKAIIVRLIVGLIFLSEGVQKYLFPELLGTGRFLKIGFSNPEFCYLLIYGGGKWSVDSKIINSSKT